MKRKTKVLLINPNVSESDLGVAGYKVFPVGLGILAAILKNEGYDVTIFDIRVESLSKNEVTSQLQTLLLDHDVVGISAIINCLGYVEWLSHEIKKIKPTAKIILGGSICTSILDIVSKTTACDVFCIGEGEETILELMAYFNETRKLDDIKGIAFKNSNSDLVKNPPRGRLLSLDENMILAYHLFKTQEYANLPSRIPNVGKNMSIIAGRGCPFSCTYCLPAFGRKIVMRPVPNIIDEIELLHSKYGVVHFDFMDDLLCFKEEWMLEFSQALIDSGLKITWRGLGRANAFSKFQDNTVSLMKKAGCNWLGFGFESASPKILEIMQKKNTVEQMQKSVDICRNHKINVTGTFIIGMPGETENTLAETRKFIYDNYLWPHFSYACPYPGTPLYKYAKERGIIGDDISFVRGIQGLHEIYVTVCDMTKNDLRRHHKALLDEMLPRLHALGINHPTALKGFEEDVTGNKIPVF